LRIFSPATPAKKQKPLQSRIIARAGAFFRYRKIREISNKPLSAFLSETLETDYTLNTDKKKVFL